MSESEVNYRLKADASGFTSEVSKAERSVEGLDKQQKYAAKSAKDMGSSTGGIDKLQKSFMGLGKTIAALGVASLGLAFAKMIKETNAQDAAMAQLNATLKSTGGAAGKTAEQLSATASSLQKMSTYADDSIIKMQGLLLKFTNIKGDNFDRATKSILDMSTALGKDLNASAVLVGKALDNPIKGMTALAKVGVTFTEGQKETIKALVETGKSAEAQALILQELEKRYKGSAEAATTTLGGALKQLGNTWGDLFEVEKTSSDGMVSSIKQLNAVIADPAFKEAMDDLVGGLVDVVKYAAEGTAALVHMYQVITDNEKKTLWTVGDKIGKLQKEIAFYEKNGSGNSAGVEKMRAELAALEKEYVTLETAIVKTARGTGQLNEVTAQGTKITTASASTTKTSTESMKALGKETTDLLKDLDKLKERHKKAQESMSEGIKEIDNMTAATDRLIEEMEFEVSLIGLTERQQAQLTAERKYGGKVLDDQAAKLVGLTMQLYDAGAATEAAAAAQKPFQDALQGTVERIDEAFASAWTGAFDSFSDFADGLVESFKQLMAELAHIAITRPIVMSIAGAFGLGTSGTATASGAGQAAGAAGQLSGLISGGLSGIGSSLSGGITGASSAIYSGIGDVATRLGMDQFAVQAYQKGLTANLSSIGTDMLAGFAGAYAGGKVFGETTGIGSTAGGIAGSIVGMGNPLFTAAGSFIGTGLERALGNLLGFGGAGENDAGRSTFNLASGRIDTAGVGGKFDQSNVDAAGGLTEVLKQFSDMLGGSNFSGSVKVGNRSGIMMGGTKYKDPEEFFQATFDAIIAGATKLDPVLKQMLHGFDGTAAQMMEFAGAVISLNDQAGINTVTTAIEDFRKVQPTVMEAYQDQVKAIDTLILNFDGSASAATELATTLAANKMAAYEFAMAIQALGAQLTETANAQATSIRESVMTAEELLKVRQFEREILQAQLPKMTDPEKISEATNRILELNRQIFDTLPEELRAERAESFAAYAEWTGAVAQDVLNRSITDLQASQERVNAQINTMLTDTAAKQQAAANTMVGAANSFAQTVASLQAQGITVTVSRGSEVNV